MKRIRLFVHDSPFSRSRRVRDEILHAEPVGKVIVGGTLWTGSLRPLIDATLDTLAPMVNGLTSGRVLNAEPVDNVLDLGRTWLGALVGQLNDAGRGFRGRVAESPLVPDVDAGEVLAEVTRLNAMLGADPQDFPGITDGFRRVRQAADKASGVRSRTTDDAVSPLTRLARVTPEHRALGDRMNAANRAFWAAQAAPATTRAIGDTSPATTAVRDALAVAARAKTDIERNAAINAANRAFWDGRRA